MLKQLMANREKEKEELQKEVDREWEVKINELTAKFDQEMARKGKKDKDKKVMTVKYQEDMEEIKKHMTVKMQKKKEGMLTPS